MTLESDWCTSLDCRYSWHSRREKRDSMWESFVVHLLGESNPLVTLLDSFCMLHVLLQSRVESCFQRRVKAILARSFTY